MALLPTTLGKYEVLCRLGAGGMAEVFLCRLGGMGGFDKRVVVKRVLPDYRHQPMFVEMFLDEARVAANLTHPNIIQIFEIGEVEGTPYIAMEYVRGPTLNQVLSVAAHQRKLSIPSAARLMVGVCEGLDYAHNARDPEGRPLGIVHRDVSPQNILVAPDGTAKVFDFGIARAEGRLVETRVASLKGKLAYMAPEQLRAQALDRRADVFAVGVCLFESTVGRPMFSAATDFDLYSLRLNHAPPAPSSIVPDYPPELEAIVMAALAHDPEQRTSSCRALADQLDAFAASGPYAATTRTVSAWIQSLDIALPSGASESRPGSTPAPRGARASIGGSPRAEGSDSELARGGAAESGGEAERGGAAVAPQTITPSSPAPRRWVWATAAGLGIFAATAGIVLWQSRRSTPVAPTPTATAASSASLRTYLSEAERLIAVDSLVPAAELLERAARLDVTDAADGVRLARLREALRQAQARVATAAAGPPATSAPPMADTTATSADAVQGSTLSVRGRSAARIYLDGQRLGSAPLLGHPVEPGHHLLEIRRAGRDTVRQRVDIAAGANVTIDLDDQATRSSAHAPALSTAPPSVASAISATPTEIAVPPPVATPTPTPPPVATLAPPLVTTPAPTPPPVATPTPTPTPTPAPVATPTPLPPRLPPTFSARSLKEVESVLSAIEGEAITRALAPAAGIRGSTRKLAQQISSDFSPGTPIVLHPRAIYQFIVDRARDGETAGAIGSSLAVAFAKGTL